MVNGGYIVIILLNDVPRPARPDQGIQMDGMANFVPSTPDAIAFTRTPQEVLRIVYLTDQADVSKGGFYRQRQRTRDRFGGRDLSTTARLPRRTI
jgi:hypothetical protein